MKGKDQNKTTFYIELAFSIHFFDMIVLVLK